MGVGDHLQRAVFTLRVSLIMFGGVNRPGLTMDCHSDSLQHGLASQVKIDMLLLLSCFRLKQGIQRMECKIDLKLILFDVRF